MSAGSWHFAEANADDRTAITFRRTNSRRGGRQALAMSLAASAATSRLRVLLIDADLRHPSASSYLGVKKAVGWVDLLLENANLQEVTKFRGCEDEPFLPTSVLPGHIKRQSDLNARS
jgi:hypothetical protein